MNATGSPLVDREARERAVSDLEHSFCMEAGAGTGKTTLLVKRYLSIIKSGNATCAQAVAITFTEKAAAEMKYRLRREIGSLIESSSTDPEQRARLEAARDELESAPISTIHSFASSILREYPVEAGIDPRFTQLDAIDTSILLDRCWERYLSGIDRAHYEAVRSWIVAGGSLEKLRSLALQSYLGRGSGKGLFGGGAGRKGDLSPRGPDSEDSAMFARRLREASAELERLAESSCTDPDDRGASAIGELSRIICLAEGLTGGRLEEFVLTADIPAPAGNRMNWSPAESCSVQKDMFRELRVRQSSLRSGYMDRTRDSLTSWFDGFSLYVDEVKSREGMLDFDDLLLRAAGLLEDRRVLDSLRSRYRFILVDEFQDTDPVQARIILLLAGVQGGTGEFDIEKGKLFVVGDPKQSIYRFRKADVEIYEKVKERLSEAGAHLKISQNFRSVPGVTEWVNTAFSSIIKPPLEGSYQPLYEPIHARREGSGPAVVSLDLDIGEAKAAEVRQAEADGGARYIRRLMKSGREIMDPVSREMRPLRFGDIAMIYRGTTGIEIYEDTLKIEGIPYLVEGGRLYYTRQEIRDLAAAVWTIEDPYDPLALVSALRSSVFGFSDEEIFLYSRAGGRFDYLSPAVPEGERFGDFARAFSLLADLHRERNETGAARTCSRLLEETGYMELSVLAPHGRQRMLNLRKAVQNARMFDTGHRSFRQFARWFKDQEILGAAEGESEAVDEMEDAVRLITIHKSKGLQFPVVIMVNLVQRIGSQSWGLMTDDGRLAVNLGQGWETGDYREAARMESLKDQAENARLMYVAATRAGDLLVIPRSTVKNNYYGIIAPFLESDGDEGGGAGMPWVLTEAASDLPAGAGEPEPPFGTAPEQEGKGRWGPEEVSAWLERRKELIERGSRGPVILTPSMKDAGKECGQAAQGVTGAGVESAMLFGTAFHRIMEVVDPGSEGSVERWAGRFASEEGIVELAGDLSMLAAETVSSELFGRACEADMMLREVPFTIPLLASGENAASSTDGPDGFISGRIDLLFREGGEWTLVDYKTDDIPESMVDGRFASYRTQGMLYALALKTFGVRLDGGVVFYFARPGVSRTLDVNGSLLEEARAFVKGALAATR